MKVLAISGATLGFFGALSRELAPPLPEPLAPADPSPLVFDSLAFLILSKLEPTGIKVPFFSYKKKIV